MIPWWWLLVEAGILIIVGAVVRGMTRAVAIQDALNDPKAARAEMLYRFGAPVPHWKRKKRVDI